MIPRIDLPLIINESEQNLFDRFKPLIKDVKSFIVPLACFQFSGFHKINPSIKNNEKSRIVIRTNTDKAILALSKQSDRSESV